MGASVQCDLTAVHSRLGGDGFFSLGHRIDCILIERRRLIEVKLVFVDHQVEKRIRLAPHESAHYLVFIHFEIPPWPGSKRRASSAPAPHPPFKA